MLATYELKTRARMYLLLTLLCGVAAGLLQLFLAGTNEFHNYAEQQLDGAVRAAVQEQATEISQMEGKR